MRRARLFREIVTGKRAYLNPANMRMDRGGLFLDPLGRPYEVFVTEEPLTEVVTIDVY